MVTLTETSESALKILMILACLLILNTDAWAHDVFITSEAEQNYHGKFEANALKRMIEGGALTSALTERDLALPEAHQLLREMARLSSVCNILGVRLYEDKYRNRMAQLITDGSSVEEIQNGIEDFLRNEVRSGEVTKNTPFEPIREGLEFIQSCLEAVKAPPVGPKTSIIKTLDIPRGYALDAESGKIYHLGNVVYESPQETRWRFSCLETEGVLSRDQGTVGVSGSQRMFPTMCDYDRSAYYGDAIKYAAWVAPQNGLVTFILSDGPGGSAANISYKLLTFDEGAFVSESKPLPSGEYFRALITQKCSALFNEYTPSQYVTLGGECSDMKSLVRSN
ncbi:hypothetical protein BEE62_07540 [Marinobacter nauticus]|uniref:Uncharacterized protein n=1 Tax=Marinobacter nauticus TaxID=2743 RepID=A0A1M2UXD1_MARNT|nr:hypothetical protein BEE62_07540 [Marinobacter nauticus]